MRDRDLKDKLFIEMMLRFIDRNTIPYTELAANSKMMLNEAKAAKKIAAMLVKELDKGSDVL